MLTRKAQKANPRPKPMRRVLLCGALVVAVGVGCGLRLGTPAEKAAASDGKDARIDFPRPASHRGDWLTFHGRTVPLMRTGPAGDNACVTCHRETDCVECHNTAKPSDHNHAWRTRTHGFYAAGNRERCLACHRQDYCVSCHQQTAPRTHRANWRDRHCTWCHFGPGLSIDANCRVCHRIAPHTSAPHDLAGRENCAACHP